MKTTKKRKLPPELTTVTKTSKTLAFVLIIILPFLGFLLGIRYQKYIQSISYEPPIYSPVPGPEAPVACTMDAMICPDGSAVGRVAPSCQFAPCPGN